MSMKNSLSVRYLVELVITVLLILFITVVLVRMFVHSRNETIYAKNLTEAVQISENMAELSAGFSDKQVFLDTVSGMERVTSVREEGGEIIADMKGVKSKNDKSGYEIRITWEEENSEYGSFVLNHIDVYCDGGAEAIYRLDVGKYKGNQEYAGAVEPVEQPSDSGGES